MKKPLRQDASFLADVEAMRHSAPGTSPSSLHLWWLGQSGFLLLWNGHGLLFDPYLSDSLTRKYAQSDKPHVRLSERVVDPARLDFVDVVISSHVHTDHLDPETLGPLAQANPHLIVVCPEAIRERVRERSHLPDARIIGLDAEPNPDSATAGELPMRPVPVPRVALSTFHTPISPFRISAVPAAHESLEKDPEGRLTCLGYVVEAGPFRVYHSGDTIRFPAMADILRPFAIDVALLPINGRRPERRVAGNLWGHEAAQLAKDIGAGLVVPCHYDMFEFNTASPLEFAATCARVGQPFEVLEQGGRLTLTAPRVRSM